MADPADPWPPELVLASVSPFRRRMLEAAGLSFKVVPADVDEPAIRDRLVLKKPSPSQVAEILARAKAEAVSTDLPSAMVIGSDQVLAVGNDLLGKPRDLAQAREQLRQLRGGSHALHTAVALAADGAIVWSHVEVATLTMRAFSDAFLTSYLAAAGDRVCQTVGAYEVERDGIQLFERIEGDYFAIIGLPLLPLLAELRSRGVIGT